MEFPLTVAQFAQWAQNNRKKRFKIREDDRFLPDSMYAASGRENSCPLATCLKNKKLAGAYVAISGSTFNPDRAKFPDQDFRAPNWVYRFVDLCDSEDTESFTGAQILRIIKEGDLCQLEKDENAKTAKTASHSVTD